MNNNKKDIIFKLIISIVLLLFFIIIVRLAVLVWDGQKNRKQYTDPVVADEVVRGTIYDRNGSILSIESPSYSLAFLLRYLPDDRLESAAQLVSPYIGMSVSEILDRASHYSTYAMIEKKLDNDIIYDLNQAVEKSGLKQGILIEKYSSRQYPASFHLAQTLGFVNAQNIGIEGIEYEYDDILNPYPGLNESTTYGRDITLTVDMNIQYLLDLEAQRISREHDPDYIVGIVMDATSGEILAMTSYPWYDLEKYGSATADQKQNKVISYTYEPGSVFKIFSLAAAMEAGDSPLETYECTGKLVRDGYTINCSSPHGTVTPENMIEKSCNGAISEWALETDDDSFYEKLCLFGFNTPLDIGLPAISYSSIKDPTKWSSRSKPTISFGQEMSTTALHLVRAASAFANEGRMVEPYIIKSIDESSSRGKTGKNIWSAETKLSERILSDNTIETVLRGMELATGENGTAKKLAVDGIRIGGKTGTSQIINMETMSYEDGTNLASTLALVPVDRPRYIIYIAAGNPKGNTIWGSNIASPAISRVISGLVAQGKLQLSV